MLEHALERRAILIELQIVHEQAHLRAMPRVTHGLVVDLLALLAVGLGQRTQAARSVERFVQGAVDLDFLEALERRGVDLLPSTTAWQGLPYSLMSPSVDQVSEYLSTLLGCWGSAPTRSFMLRSSSKCLVSSLAAMLMKPGASPHWGTKAALHLARCGAPRASLPRPRSGRSSARCPCARALATAGLQ